MEKWSLGKIEKCRENTGEIDVKYNSIGRIWSIINFNVHGLQLVQQ